MGTGFAAGTFQIGFIMGMELIGPSKRVLGAAILMFSCTIGRILLGCIAMCLQDFSLIIQCVYMPSVLVLAYLWIMPGSLKWLVAKGKKDEALVVIYKAAKTNKVIFSDGAMRELLAHSIIWWSQDNMDVLYHKQIELSIWKSRVLLTRAIGCLSMWFLITLINSGLFVNYSEMTNALADSVYWKFIFTSILEIPSYIFAYYMMNRISRKWAQCISVFGGAVFLFISIFLNTSIYQHLLHILTKCCLTMSTIVLSTVTSELFPTYMRCSVFCTCSVFGKIGIILSPYTQLLVNNIY